MLNYFLNVDVIFYTSISIGQRLDLAGNVLSAKMKPSLSQNSFVCCCCWTLFCQKLLFTIKMWASLKRHYWPPLPVGQTNFYSNNASILLIVQSALLYRDRVEFKTLKLRILATGPYCQPSRVWRDVPYENNPPGDSGRTYNITKYYKKIWQTLVFTYFNVSYFGKYTCIHKNLHLVNMSYYK